MIGIGEPDAGLEFREDMAEQVAELIRDLQPHLIVTHWEGSFHDDHRNPPKLSCEAYSLFVEGGILGFDYRRYYTALLQMRWAVARCQYAVAFWQRVDREKLALVPLPNILSNKLPVKHNG